MARCLGPRLYLSVQSFGRCHLRTSQRVGPQVRIEIGCNEGRLLHTTHPCRPSNGASLRCRKDPILRSRLLQSGDLFDELLGDRPRGYHRPSALRCLRWTDDNFAPYVGRGSADANQTSKGVEVAVLESVERA